MNDAPATRRLAAGLILLLLACLPLAAAQPYAAAGGFDRPVLQEAAATAATAGVAVSSAGDVTTTVWAGREGVWRVDRTAGAAGTPTLVAETDDVRAVSAAYVDDELAITWVTRDRRTGVYHHFAQWGDGERRDLFEDALIIELQLFGWQGEPWAAGLFRREGQGQLRLIPLLGGDDLVVYRTGLAQRGLDLLAPPSGELWVGWLEGKNERGEFGLVSEWDAYVARVAREPAGGFALTGPAALGEANVEDERQAVALLSREAPAGSGAPQAVWALWPDAEADLRLSEVTATGAALAVGAPSAPLGRGRPLGAAWPHLYYVEGASIMRLGVDDPEPISIAWSPVTIEGAVLATGGEVAAVAWFGRAQGGRVEVYMSDDRTAMGRTVVDRLAALMGWSPWHLWDELIGQVLTALLVGVVFAVALVPLLMMLTPFLVRFFRRPARALTAGLVLGVIPVVAAGYVYGRSVGPAAGATGPGLPTIAAAALFGLLVGWLAGRRGDREAQGTMTLAGAVTAFAGVTLWSFLTYREWAPFIGLS